MNTILKEVNGISFSMLLEGGVINRNEGIGNIIPAKKLNSYDGQKVSFSDKAYKRALYSTAEKRINEWGISGVSNIGGVAQKISTIIESDEFDLSGTMVAKDFVVKRESVFRVGQGISINNYKGDTEFLTNMALANRLGEDTNPYTRENFHGLYRLSGHIDLDRLGKEDCLVETKLPDNFVDTDDKDLASSLLFKIVNGNSVVGFPSEDKFMEFVNNRVETISLSKEGEGKIKILIDLKGDEKIKRLKKILYTIPEVYRNIEARVEPLSPVFITLYYGTLCPFIHNYLRPESEGGVIKSFSPLTVDTEVIKKKLENREITKYSFGNDPIDAITNFLNSLNDILWK